MCQIFIGGLPLWWYKLLKYWSVKDYVTYFITTGPIFFGLSVLRLTQGKTIDLLYVAVLVIVMPLPLLALATIQKYSANIDEISDYPTVLPADFDGSKMLKDGRVLVFFYAEWCPFCRRSFPHLKNLKSTVKHNVFRADISDVRNILWNTFEVKVIPTLIIFENGSEVWRRNGRYIEGLGKADFKEAIDVLHTSP